MLEYQKMVGKRFITLPPPPKASLEEDARKIAEFGITQNQAKIYLAILSLGTTQIEPISKISSVRREDIYRILPRLYELGIVERVIGTPTRVRALPVEKAIRILARNRQEALSRESSEIMYLAEDFLEYFNPADVAPPEEDGGEQFSLVEGRLAVEGKIAGMLGRAKREVLVSSGSGPLPLFPEIPGIVGTVPERGLSIRIITDQSEFLTLSAVLKDLKSRNLDFRLAGPRGNGGKFVVCDGKEAIIITSGEGSSSGCSSLWTTNAQMISLVTRNFEHAWSGAGAGDQKAAPVAEERPGARVSDPDPVF